MANDRTTPADPPDGSFTGALRRTWDDFSNDRIMAVGAGCAFYILLAVFPAIAALVSIYGLIGDVGAIDRQLDAMSAGFTWYAAHFGSFNKTYGSLGAVVGCMIWIWLSVTIVLVGAELNAEIERRAQATGARTQEAG